MTSIFMVHSVLAVAESGKVNRDYVREEAKYASGNNQEQNLSFSDILHREVEERRTDSIDCHTTTYGMDRRLHHFQYQAREYHY